MKEYRIYLVILCTLIAGVVTAFAQDFGGHPASNSILIYVLSDRYEDNNWEDWYRNPEHLSSVASNLTSIGFQVHVIDRKSNDTLPIDSLLSYSQVWISECDIDSVVEVTPDEINALVSFAKAGGGVWLSLEGTLWGEDWTEDVMAYAYPFGCRWLNNHYASSPRTVSPSNHPLLRDIQWLKFDGEVGEISSTNSTLTTLWEYAPGCAGILAQDAHSRCEGRVVIDSGWLMGYCWYDSPTAESYSHGNMRFIQNLARWLEPVPVCSIQKIWIPAHNYIALEWASLGEEWAYSVETCSSPSDPAWILMPPTNQWPILPSVWTNQIGQAPQGYFRIRAEYQSQ